MNSIEKTSTPRGDVSTNAVAMSWTPMSWAAEYALFIAFFLLVLFFAMQTDTFISASNAQNIMRQSAVTAIAAVGISLLFIGGGIDISQGAVMAVSGLFVVWLLNAGVPIVFVLAFGIGLGAVFGLVNSIFAEIIGIPALIATLGTGLVIRGLGFVATEGRSVAVDREVSASIEWLGRAQVLGVPVPFVIAAALAIGLSVALSRTAWGRHILAIGGNPSAATTAGISVRSYRVVLYAIGGATSALAGTVLVGRLSAASPGAVPTAEFDVITVAVLAGVSIYGGVGRLHRVLVSALFVAALTNGLVQLNVPSFWSRVVTGAVFLLALSLDSLRKASAS